MLLWAVPTWLAEPLFRQNQELSKIPCSNPIGANPIAPCSFEPVYVTSSMSPNYLQIVFVLQIILKQVAGINM